MPRASRATVRPCDEEDEHGHEVRTWDVCRDGVAIASGFRTRAAARVEAARLNVPPEVVQAAFAAVDAEAARLQAAGRTIPTVERALLADAVSTALQPWHVDAARAVLRLKAEGDEDITDEQVEAAKAVIDAARAADLFTTKDGPHD